MKQIQNAIICLILTIFIIGCSGTKTIAKYDNWELNKLVEPINYEGDASTFFCRFKIAISLSKDSIQILVYGGNRFTKAGYHDLNETSKLIPVSYSEWDGSIIEPKDERISITQNTFFYKIGDEEYFRFRLMEYNEEFEIKVHKSNKTWLALIEEYVKWKENIKQ